MVKELYKLLLVFQYWAIGFTLQFSLIFTIILLKFDMRILKTQLQKILFSKTPLVYGSVINIITLLDWCFREINTASLLVSIVFTYLTAYIFYAISPVFSKIAGSLVIIIEFVMIYLYYIAHFDIVPNTIWIFLIQTNTTEISRFLTWKFFALFFVALVLLVGLWRFTRNKTPQYYSRFQVVLSLVIAFVFIKFLLIGLYNKIFYYSSNVNYIPIPYSTTFHMRHRVLAAWSSLSQEKKDYSLQLEYHNKPLNIYAMIGESANGKHFGINGYHRQTTPLLAKEKLINFGLNRSCASITYLSWKYMFYNIECSQDVLNAPQQVFPYYFTKVGYPTFIVSQDDEDSMLAVVKSVQRSSGIHSYKDNMYSAFKQMDTPSPNKLFILNSFGSHPPYMTPPIDLTGEFQPKMFNPDLYYDVLKPENHTKLLNTYDNTILFLDWQIAHIIQDLKKSKEPTLLFYTSDHGERLNEDGKGYGHGGSQVNDMVVPFFVWVNDPFKTTYPNEYKNLLLNAQRYKNQLTHEVIWHSIMSLGGFKNKPQSKVIDSKRNIFSEDLKPRIPKDWFLRTNNP